MRERAREKAIRRRKISRRNRKVDTLKLSRQTLDDGEASIMVIMLVNYTCKKTLDKLNGVDIYNIDDVHECKG